MNSLSEWSTLILPGLESGNNRWYMHWYLIGIPGLICWTDNIIQPNFILSPLPVIYEMRYRRILFADTKHRIFNWVPMKNIKYVFGNGFHQVWCVFVCVCVLKYTNQTSVNCPQRSCLSIRIKRNKVKNTEACSNVAARFAIIVKILRKMFSLIRKSWLYILFWKEKDSAFPVSESWIPPKLKGHKKEN